MKNFFIKVAKRHKDLLHDENNKKKRFISIPTTNKLIFPADELLNEIKAIDYELFMVYSDDQNMTLTGQNNYNLIAQKYGTVYILRKVRLNDKKAIEAAFEKTRNVITDIINYMQTQDDKHFDLTHLEIRPIHKVFDNCYGTYFNFSYMVCFDNKINTDKWI